MQEQSCRHPQRGRTTTPPSTSLPGLVINCQLTRGNLTRTIALNEELIRSCLSTRNAGQLPHSHTSSHEVVDYSGVGVKRDVHAKVGGDVAARAAVKEAEHQGARPHADAGERLNDLIAPAEFSSDSARAHSALPKGAEQRDSDRPRVDARDGSDSHCAVLVVCCTNLVGS